MNTGSKNKDPRVETKTITESQSEPIWLSGRYGPLIARIPVIISQSKIHINIKSEVYLDRFVVDIRNYSRKVFLTQCKLLDLGNKRQGKIHLNGHINESIEYASQNNTSDKSLNSADICYKTFKVPFECAAKIEYSTRPMFKTANQFISVSLPEMVNETENLNLSRERFFGELDDVTICESDILRENTLSEDNDNDNQIFDALVEYMIVSITFTLLQWQQVSIPRNLPYNAQ